MKKTLLILFVIASLQTLTSQNVVYGVKGGLNYASLYGSNNFNAVGVSGLKQKFRLGFHAGGFVKIEIKDNFYLQPELLFSLQGSKQNIDNIQLIDQFGNPIINSLDVRIFTNLFYINLPIMGKYYIDEKFNFEFGPQFGYLLSAKFKSKVVDRGGISDEILAGANIDGESDIESTNNFDVGLNLGMGYDLTKEMEIGLRYNLGLTKNFGLGSPLKNSVLQIGLAYSLN